MTLRSAKYMIRQWRRTYAKNEHRPTIGRVQAIDNLATTIARITGGGRPVWQPHGKVKHTLEQQQ